MGSDPMQTVVRCKKCGKTYSAGVVNKDFEGVCPSCVAFLALDDIEASPLEAAPPADDRTTVYLKPGTVFEGLEIVSIMGQGGMGVVYKARQTGLDRLVAVKVMSDRLAGDAEFVKRFEKEARAMAALSHPNIVAVYNFGVDAGRCFIVMEFVDGVNLRQVIRDRKLLPEEALRIVPQLCDALEYAHGEGVVHRDIKPENILLDRKGRVKITDFGLAKIVNPDRVDHTVTGLVMGTPHYMAPEQVETPKEVDHRADIFSMGVVFYELLTGQLPIGRFEPPSHRGAVDVRLDNVVMRALEREPARRYQHAGELKTEVSRITDNIPVARLADPAAARAVPVPPPPSPMAPTWVVGAAAPVPAAPALPQQLSRWVGTGFGLNIAAIVLGLAAVVTSGSVSNADGARTALFVVGSIGGLFGVFGLLCTVIGLFEVLFSNGRWRGFGLAFLSLAMDFLLIFMIVLGWLIVPTAAIGRVPRPGFDGPSAVATPSSDLLRGDLAAPPGWKKTSSRDYEGTDGLAELWQEVQLEGGDSGVVRARRVGYRPPGAFSEVLYHVFEFRPGASHARLHETLGAGRSYVDSGNLLVIFDVENQAEFSDPDGLAELVRRAENAIRQQR